MSKTIKNTLRRSVGFIAAAVLALPPLSGHAGAPEPESIVTDRPDFTESTDTVPEGRFQLEGGYTFARAGGDEEVTTGELLLRVAAGPRTELRVGVPSYGRIRAAGGNGAGLEDASVGVKVRLAKGSSGYGLGRPNVSLIAATTLPTGASAYRENTLQPEAKLCLSWDLSDRLGLSSNLNYAYLSEDGQRFGQFSGSVSLGMGLTERVGTYLETFGFTATGPDGADAGYLNAGVTYLVSGDYQLDARIGVGFNGLSDDYFVGVGAARRW